MKAFALLHQLVPVDARVDGTGEGLRWRGFFLDRGIGSAGGLGGFPAGSEHLIPLCTMVDDIQLACSLRHSIRELMEVTVLDTVRDAQLLEFSSELMIELILPVILSNACFCCEKEKFREEVMELITGFHKQLAELLLCSGGSVWVTVNHFEVVEHVL